MQQQILEWLQSHLTLWVTIGLFGQFMFMMRFIYQWIASERARKSVMPEIFWYFSLGGGIILFAYAVHKEDPVFIVGQGLGLIIYLRNIYFIWQQKNFQPKIFERLTSIPKNYFTANGERLTPLAYTFLVLLCFAFFIPGIASLPPTDRDESLFAQASKQMIETGNYVDIKVQDQPRYKKPIGIYWLQTAAVKTFNPTQLNEIWAYRIPSFVGATIAVCITAALGSLLFTPLIGLLAAIMLAGCVLMNVESRMATTDASLLATIMAAQYALARAYLARDKSIKNVLIFWTALAAGFLLKGPIILLVVIATLLWLHRQDKNLKWSLALKPWIGLPYFLLLAAPWFILIIMQSNGAFLEHSAGQDMLAKLWQGQDRGVIWPGAHLLALPIAFFPFALFAFLAIPDTWENRAQPAIRFCLGWIIPVWIVFELAFTKLPHYVLPLYPAIALLAAKALIDGYPALAAKGWRWLLAFGVGLWLMIGTGYAVLFAALPYIANNAWSPGQIAVGAILMLAQGACLFLLFGRKPNSIIVMAFGSLFFMSCTFGNTLPSIDKLWLSRQALQTAELIKPCEKTAIVSASYREPSLVFMAGTKTELYNDGALAAEAIRQDQCKIALVDRDHAEAFLKPFSNQVISSFKTAKIEGLNIGHGGTAELTMYAYPSRGPQ